MAWTTSPSNASAASPRDRDRIQQVTTSACGAVMRASPRRGPTVALTIAALVWLSGVAGALVLLNAYAGQPGATALSPRQWPRDSAIQFDTSRAMLLMFAHPRCPCTRASLGELEGILARCQDRFSAHVLFLQPSATADDWADTDLWRAASVVPGLSVHRDHDGVEATRFGAVTSGQVLLYDRTGRLAFQGGITLSRGHSGDNPGRDAVEAWPQQQGASAPIDSPVFGCALFESGQSRGSQCRP